jgi:hypothetical protein
LGAAVNNDLTSLLDDEKPSGGISSILDANGPAEAADDRLEPQVVEWIRLARKRSRNQQNGSEYEYGDGKPKAS